MYFELQLSADVFGRIVRNRLKALNLCIEHEGVDKDGIAFVLDHVDISEGTIIRRQASASQTWWLFSYTNYTSYTVPFLQVRQPVRIWLVKKADLDVNGPNPSTPYFDLTIYPVFNVSLQVMSEVAGKGGPVQLSYGFDRIEYGIAEALVPEGTKANLNSLMGSFPLHPTTVDLSPLSKQLGRPVAAINAGITCNSGGDFVAMRIEIRADEDMGPEFFTQDPANLLNGRDWAMMADARIFIEDTEKKIKEELKDSTKLKLDSGPTVSWDPTGPAWDIHVEAEAVDACPFNDMDLDVDATVRATLSVPKTNTLRTHYKIDAGTSDVAEDFLCAVTGALLWPILGLALFDKDEIDLPEYVAGLLLYPYLALVAILFAIETAKAPEGSGSGENCKKIDDENYECEDDFSVFLPGLGGHLDLLEIRGISQGPVLAGAVSNLQDYRTGTVTNVNTAPFAWRVEGKCPSAFTIRNAASIGVGVEPPAALCKAKVVDDPLGEFLLEMGDNDVTIRPKFLAAYRIEPPPGQNRYPCRVHLTTTRGVRRITIPSPSEITAAEEGALETGRLRATAECQKWIEPFTPREELGWLVDPPFRGERYARFWQALVVDLEREERITVYDGEGQMLGWSAPSPGGRAHLAFLFDEEAQPERLLVELGGGRGEARAMGVQQALYRHTASIPAPAEVKRLAFERATWGRVLVYESGGVERRWSLTAPALPTLYSMAGASAELENAGPVVHGGKRVTASIPERLRGPLSVLESRTKGIRVIGAPKIAGLREALFIGGDGEGTVYDVSNPKDPREAQGYAGRPWFEGTALGGRFLARHNGAGGRIDVYEAAAVCTI